MSASDDLFTASVAQREGIVVLSIGGAIDFASASTFEAVVANVIAQNAAGLVIDLGGVKFMASAGLRVLILAQEQLARFAVAAIPAAMSRQIQVVGLDKILPLYSSIEDAVAALT